MWYEGSGQNQGWYAHRPLRDSDGPEPPDSAFLQSVSGVAEAPCRAITRQAALQFTKPCFTAYRVSSTLVEAPELSAPPGCGRFRSSSRSGASCVAISLVLWPEATSCNTCNSRAGERLVQRRARRLVRPGPRVFSASDGRDIFSAPPGFSGRRPAPLRTNGSYSDSRRRRASGRARQNSSSVYALITSTGVRGRRRRDSASTSNPPRPGRLTSSRTRFPVSRREARIGLRRTLRLAKLNRGKRLGEDLLQSRAGGARGHRRSGRATSCHSFVRSGRGSRTATTVPPSGARLTETFAAQEQHALPASRASRGTGGSPMTAGSMPRAVVLHAHEQVAVIAGQLHVGARGPASGAPRLVRHSCSMR